MKNIIQKTLEILSRKDKKNIFLAILLLIIKTIFDVLSIGLIIPILHFSSSNKEKIFLTEYIPFLDQVNKLQTIVFFVSIFLFVYLIKTVFIIYYNRWSTKLLNILAVDLSRRVLEKYLKNDYIFFLENNSAYIIRNVSSETTIFASGFIGNVILTVTQIFFIVAVCSFLVILNPYSIYVILILASLNAIIVISTNNKFKKWGLIRHEITATFLKKLHELIGGIKEVILYNTKLSAIDDAHDQMKKLANSNINRDITLAFTAPIIELLGILIFFSFFLILIIYSSLSLKEVLVIFGIFAFSAIKLLPAIISLVKSIQAIKFNAVSVDVIHKILNKNKGFKVIKEKLETEKCNLKSLNLQNVSFRYNTQKEPTLSNVTFDINKGDKIGIIGETGSGKSTLLNLISSLINPTSGIIKINNSSAFNYTENIRNHIGYVSQSVYLSDESILFNIALAKDVLEEERNKIILILEKLNLGFINNQKVDENSSLGERGVKLSGGQIQRIGIARALYRNPDILILDEATNALDHHTEEKILDYLFKTLKNKILILCTHKKELLKYCNKIVEVKNNTISIKENKTN